jgi:hypothetical protein
MRAQLRWDQTIVTQEAKIGQESITIPFTFTNTGTRPITIIDLKPDCGCTTATLDQKTIPPGAKGTVEAYLDAKGLTGLLEKNIRVFSDDSAQPTVLTFRVNLPAWLEISPRLVWWNIGERTSEKAAVVTLPPDVDLRLISLRAESSEVETSLRPDASGKRYQVIVRPRSTATAALIAIKLVAELPNVGSRAFLLYAQIR